MFVRLIDWIAGVGFVIGVCLVAAWSMITSDQFIKVSAVRIQGDVVRVIRELPRGPATIRYVESVRPILTGTEVATPCQDAPLKPFRYPTLEWQPGPYEVKWSIGRWAAPCLTGDYVWRAEWYVYLFGIVPLKPTRAELVVRT